MSHQDKISRLEQQINMIRSEIIKTISAINRILCNNPKATNNEEYQALKSYYYSQKEEIHCLASLKKDLGKTATPNS